MRLNINDCEACLTHELSPLTEDGERYLMEVWDVVARTTDGCTFVYHDSSWDERDAKEFAARVEGYGNINPDLWAEVITSELPDYVTDPHRPEFN
jgi:hypothetical protein